MRTEKIKINREPCSMIIRFVQHVYITNIKKLSTGKKRKELVDLLNQYKKDGSYDVLIPGSGGKDSIFVASLLKEKYGMNPLTCTWAPHMYTDVGWRNYINWIDSGYDNYFFKPNGKIHRILTRLSFKNLLHPFQPFAQVQACLPAKVAYEKNIKLVIYGDSYAERGLVNLHTFNNKYVHHSLITFNNEKDLYYGVIV